MKVTEDKELSEQPDPVFIDGQRIEGGPQMLQVIHYIWLSTLAVQYSFI